MVIFFYPREKIISGIPYMKITPFRTADVDHNIITWLCADAIFFSYILLHTKPLQVLLSTKRAKALTTDWSNLTRRMYGKAISHRFIIFVLVGFQPVGLSLDFI